MHPIFYLRSSLLKSAGTSGRIFNEVNRRTTITRMPSQSTVCSPNTTTRVLQWVHTSLSSGHPGIHCTTTLVRNAFYWPYINKDVVNFVKTCSVLKPLVSYLQVYYNHCQFHTIFGLTYPSISSLTYTIPMAILPF